MFQKNLCPHHDQVLELFCRSDQQLLCSLCLQHHKDHHTVAAAEERDLRQQQLPARRALLLHRLQSSEIDLEQLHQEAQSIRCSAQTAARSSEERFSEMLLLLETRRSEVEAQIRTEQETKLRRVQKLQDQLQQNVVELRRSLSELDALALTPDHSRFLLLWPSLASDPRRAASVRRPPEQQQHFQSITSAVSALRDRLQLALEEDPRVVAPGPDSRLLPEAPTRERLLQFSQHITLDPDSAQSWLCLSEGDSRATVSSVRQSREEHPDRFTDWGQVLSSEGLTGRCYWEVEWGRLGVRIAVSYRDIPRKGRSRNCRFGNNNKSWALYCDRVNGSYSFSFNSEQWLVSGPLSSRIGVFLDHGAGVLSFYSVSGTMILLHSVRTVFTQPLYAGVGLGFLGDTAHFPKL